MSFFDSLKQLLEIVVANPEVVRTNSILQNVAYAAQLNDSIRALTPDVNIKLDYSKVSASTGLLSSDPLSKQIKFKPKGSNKLTLGWLEANTTAPRKIHVRLDGNGDTPADGRRYIVTDSTLGVLFFGESGELRGAVPGFNEGLTGGYQDATAAISFTVGATEYVAIAMPTHQCVRVYSFPNFALICTIGIYDVPGVPDFGPALTEPTDIAFDEATSTLYICCEDGVATGATGNGFVCSFDCTTVNVPVFGSYVAVNKGQRLLHGQVNVPNAIVFDPTLAGLWIVSNGPILELGCVKVEGIVSHPWCVAFLETAGPDFNLALAGFGIKRLFLRDVERQLYVGSLDVHVFDLATLKHQKAYAYYAVEDTLSSRPPVFNLTAAGVNAIAADTLDVDGTTVDVFLTGDDQNRRIMRVSEDVYNGDNLVTFSETLFGTAPVRLFGFLVQGDLPSSQVVLEYKTSATDSWHVLSQIDVVPASVYFQFRLRINLTVTDIIEDHSIRQVTVIGELA